MTITMDKKYRTRDGRPVRILCIDAKQWAYPVLALVQNDAGTKEELNSFAKDGKFGSSEENRYDLIEILPYEDFKVDDRVWVRDHPADPWKPRHFARVDVHGRPLTWISGKTSFSVGDERYVVGWKFCVKVKPDDAPCNKASK